MGLSGAKKFDASPWIDRRAANRPGSGNSRVPYELRSDFERDRGRIIHAPCFRRLQAKTQVLDVVEGDYHRTRLTHTIEVAQIARGIVQRLIANAGKKHSHLIADAAIPGNDLIEAIAFAHDIGHPPFGHNGEVALNYMMRDHGGFEGNAQSLRLVARIENRFSRDETRDAGLDLTRRVLLGILKYPRPYSQARPQMPLENVSNFRILKQEDWVPPKCYYDSEEDIVAWLREPVQREWQKFVEWKTPPSQSKPGKTGHKTLDCSIMELADDIAYVTHDLEDGIALGFIKPDDWHRCFGTKEFSEGSGWDEEREESELAKVHWAEWSMCPKSGGAESLDKLSEYLFAHSGTMRRHAISVLIGGLMHSVVLNRHKGFRCELLAQKAILPKGMDCLKNRLQELTLIKVIGSAELQTLEYRGRLMIMEMFEAIQSDPMKLLPNRQRDTYSTAPDRGVEPMRVICDFIAGMTDSYATRYYDRLFTPRSGSAFDKL